jgi:tRNA G37 N-methylase TrmD
LEANQYTRPEVFYPNPKNKRISWKVPKVLLSGNHKEIEEYRNNKLK